jgi:hypothetical protein
MMSGEAPQLQSFLPIVLRSQNDEAPLTELAAATIKGRPLRPRLGLVIWPIIQATSAVSQDS